jgi:hypothetical protein
MNPRWSGISADSDSIVETSFDYDSWRGAGATVNQRLNGGGGVPLIGGTSLSKY